MRYAIIGTVLFTGCSALAAGSNDSSLEPPTPAVISGSGTGGAAAPIPIFHGGVAGTGVGASSFDNALAPVVTSEVPPAAINGGTLLIAKDGHTAVAADPDRDRVSIADLATQQVLATVSLQPGDEPGRMVEDGAGRVHVVLRKTGEIATIDLATRSVQSRRLACQVPQGIAYDGASDELLIACTEGDLVTMPAAGGEVSKRVFVAQDLRDVIVSGDHRLVSRFKSAELIDVDATGAITTRTAPGRIKGPFTSLSGLPPGRSDPAGTSFDATVAWRTLAMPDGRVMMLHQRAQATPIALAVDDPHGSGTAGGAADDGSMTPVPTQDPGAFGGSAYGGGDGCNAIVRPALSMTNGSNMALDSGPVLPVATLAVDAAASPDGTWLAIAVAGSRNDRGTSMFGQVGAMVFSASELGVTANVETGTCQSPGFDTRGSVFPFGQVVGVAFDAQNRLVLQTREPNSLRVVSQFERCAGCDGGDGGDFAIELGGSPRLDSGQDLFHQDAGAGLACASCHPGGGDDGHTWVFDSVGERRTQLFNMGIRNTLPLHWDGEFATFTDLVKEVFVRRMGGEDLDGTHVDALANWIETLSPNAPMRAGDDVAAQRGKALFESKEVGCTGCHNGAMLTNNTTVDVGTGGLFQVPSLIGVAYHQPYMHTGCAATLRDRFDPACGGSQHGTTGQLNDAQIDDLVAFLQTL